MQQPIGKKIAENLYAHLSALEQFDSDTQALIGKASNLAHARPNVDFNVFKLNRDGIHLSLLNYPGFFEEAFPKLFCYWTIDLKQGAVRFRTYADSFNPPILHRKELLLSPTHPQRKVFAALTATAESIGLFDDTARIGFLQAWNALLAQKGYRVVDHDLLPLGNDESEAAPDEAFSAVSGVARHLTALTRYGFSAPVQTLTRFGFLDGSKTLFDYGCGRGDDVRGLRENGLVAAGWDPYYAKEAERQPAHIVNLGFVINVIEDPAERLDAVQKAYELSRELLVVSAMLANPEAVRGKPYGDGVLTARNTFQKYYTQSELRAYLAEVLDEEPIAVGPGIFYVFKDKDVEQRFLAARQVNRRNILRLTHLSRAEKPKRRDKAEEKYQLHRELLESLWETCLTLGRDPDRTEAPNLDELIAHFGSLPAALRFVKARKDDSAELLEQARKSRIEDLRIYFAQEQFERRKPYRRLESRLQNDVKAFFGDYREAQQAGRELLFAAGHPETIHPACREASERGIGWFEEPESLTLPTSLVVQLPPVLRAYVACGLRLYGDAESADLIKIHVRSGKLTLMSFNDFENTPLPRLIQRVKIKLREQDLDIFDYGGDYEPPYLYRKSRYLNEEFSHYEQQLAFDDTLEGLQLFDFSGYGPKPAEFDARLAAARWEIDGFRLKRSRSIPDLDAPCGRYFTYRQLIECGETQARTGLSNLPSQPESYTALYELAANLLDPVIDYFGRVQLTYGFCSPGLARHIPARIAPKLDQHAAHELNRRGQPVCPRLGAAVDFIVADEDMEEVVRWIMANLTFDRLYFYGKDRPLHISYSETPMKEAYEMREVGGKRVPRRFS